MSSSSALYVFYIITIYQQVELKSSTLECDSLHEQLQCQRESATASLNRVQKHNEEKCRDLRDKIQDLNGQLNEVQSK